MGAEFVILEAEVYQCFACVAWRMWHFLKFEVKAVQERIDTCLRARVRTTSPQIRSFFTPSK